MAYSTAETGKNLETIVRKVVSKKQRIALTLQGKPVAAVVPIEDLEYLERIEAEEEMEDIRQAKLAMKDFRKNGGIPWAQAKKELGCK